MRRISLEILEPCHEPWEAMTPVAGGRHCQACDKRVVDLTLATEAKMQAIAALYGDAGLCTRFMVRPGNNTFVAAVPEAIAGPRMTSPLARRAAMVASLAMPAVAMADKQVPAQPQVVACEAPVAPPLGRQAPAASSAAPARPSAPSATSSSAAPPPPRPVPLGGAPRMVDTQTGDITQAGVFFARNKTDLTSSSAVLDEIAREILTGPKFARISIVGSAELTESRGHALSLRRAQAVRKALIERGVSPKILVAVGTPPKVFATVRATLRPGQTPSTAGYTVDGIFYPFTRAAHFSVPH